MSAILQLQLDQPPTRSQSVHGAVVTVRQVASGDGGYPDQPFETALVVEGGQVGTSIEVPHGGYRLEARLPSGRVLREQRTLSQNSHELVQFRTGDSSHEWLGWQTASGNVAPASIYDERLKNFSAQDSDRGFTKIFDDARGSNLDLSRPDGNQGLWLPSDFNGGGIVAGGADGTDGYFELGTGVSRRLALPSNTAKDLFAPVQIPPLVRAVSATVGSVGVQRRIEPVGDYQGDGMVKLWSCRFPNDVSDWQGPDGAEEPAHRVIAIVALESATLVAFLPVPWIDQSGQAVEIELLHDLSRSHDRGFRISVIDGERSALLSYLGASRMVEASIAFDAQNFGEQVLQEMEAKRRNPLAAAAAAYVGLSFPAGDERRDRWSPWLANLMNWFPAISDGAILYARDIIERAETEDHLKRALHALMTAFMRGPPYFAAGVRHLLDGLSLFTTTSERYGLPGETVQMMHALVSNFALLTDPNQTFTVIKLRPGFLHV